MDVLNAEEPYLHQMFDHKQGGYDWIKVTGSVAFIGLLLLMSGVEPNPGPATSNKVGAKVSTSYSLYR